MTAKLYYATGSRALRPRWLLEELGVPYELVRFDLNAEEKPQKTEEYLALHPLGRVPTLIDGDATMWESSAICLYLSEKHGAFGATPGTPERARFLQWMSFAQVTFETALIDIVRNNPERPEFPSSDASIARANDRFDEVLKVLADTLRDQDYLLADFSAADILVGAILMQTEALGSLPETNLDEDDIADPDVDLDDAAVLRTYLDRLKARPAFQRATAD